MCRLVDTNVRKSSFEVGKCQLTTYLLNISVRQCHAGCRSLIPEECNFGALQPIFLPPSAVSIPRTEVPMEAIIGVQVRPPPSQRDFGCRKLLPSQWARPARAQCNRRGAGGRVRRLHCAAGPGAGAGGTVSGVFGQRGVAAGRRRGW